MRPYLRPVVRPEFKSEVRRAQARSPYSRGRGSRNGDEEGAQSARCCSCLKVAANDRTKRASVERNRDWRRRRVHVVEPLRVTIEKNGLVDLEEHREPHVSYMADVVRLAGTGALSLSVPASAATETPKPGEPPMSNFRVFREFVDRLGLQVEYLNPIMRVGMDFLGNAVLAGGEGSRLEYEIFEAIAPPGVSYDPPAAGDLKKWRNVINDVRVLWCHITYGTDVLLTRDDRLIRRSARFAHRGANVMTPHAFLASQS